MLAIVIIVENLYPEKQIYIPFNKSKAHTLAGNFIKIYEGTIILRDLGHKL